MSVAVVVFRVPVRFFAGRDNFFLDFDSDTFVHFLIFAGCGYFLDTERAATALAFR